MPDLTMSIPHQLTREEAKRHIREQLGQFQRQFSGTVQIVEERWDSNTVHLTVAAIGQIITGKARVEERVVEVSVALPWMLALLAGGVREGIEPRVRQLLRPPSTP
jgi:hypothetical protein